MEFHTCCKTVLKGRYFVFTGMLDPILEQSFEKNLKKLWYLIEKNMQESNTLLLTSENEKKA